MDTNTVQKEAASSGYTFYDPSDYTAEQAAEIAHAESQTVAKSEANERREYWERRGYMQPVDFGEFLRRDYKVEFLVDRCLVANQSCIIAGASKSLKTTTSLHLALALASGKPFLNQFATTKTPVMFASAESGEVILQRNLLGMAAMMEITEQEKGGTVSKTNVQHPILGSANQ